MIVRGRHCRVFGEPALQHRLAIDGLGAVAGWRNAAILMLNNRWILPVEHMADQALAVSPDDFLALYLKGLALRGTGRLKDAAIVLRRVVQLEPGFLSANLELASTLLQSNEPAEATAILKQVELTARSGPALFQLAIVHQQAGNEAQARVLLDRALKTVDQGNWRREAERRLQTGEVATTRKGNVP